MEFIGNSREKFFYYNTLICLIKAVQNKNITVDLRNDAYVCGKLVTVDGHMNITLADVVYCDPQGNEYKFEDLFVQSRNIRYIHIPDSMPMLQTIKQELKKKEKVKTTDEKSMEKSRKRQKALSRHLQTVATL